MLRTGAMQNFMMITCRDHYKVSCLVIFPSQYLIHSLLDAYATCALFISRNETNATFVARHVIEKAQLLMEERMPIPPIDILARTQALLLYQIILISSGDVR